MTTSDSNRPSASSSHLLLPLLLIAMVAAAPAPARAQPRLSDEELLRLKERVASEVWIYRARDANEHKEKKESEEEEPIHGYLTKLTGDELTVLVDRHEETLPLDSVKRIERRGDTIWDGFGAGAFAGLLEWGVLIASASHHESAAAKVHAALFTMGFMGVVGAGIDAMAVGRTTVYDTARRDRRARPGPGVALSADRRGAMFAWTVRF